MFIQNIYLYALKRINRKQKTGYQWDNREITNNCVWQRFLLLFPNHVDPLIR